MTTLFIVRSNPVSGKEAEFNAWYDNVHLPEILGIEGFLSARRFGLEPHQMQPEQQHAYLAIYEIESDDVEGTLARLRSATLKMTGAIDSATLQVSIFRAR